MIVAALYRRVEMNVAQEQKEMTDWPSKRPVLKGIEDEQIDDLIHTTSPSISANR